MNKIIITILIFFSISNVSSAATNYEKATIRLLDKITAKSSLIDIDINKIHNHGSLDIKIYKCWNAPLDQKPETKMLVEVLETKKSGKEQIFFGWLFASSPSISSIEHPIYDITAIKCNKIEQL